MADKGDVITTIRLKVHDSKAHSKILDPFALSDTISLFRITKARYADLSGLGSAMYPGRWNGKGTPAIYASPEIGTAALEVLSHLPKDVIPRRHAVMKINLKLAKTFVLSSIPETGDFAATYIDSEGKPRTVDEVDYLLPILPNIRVFRDFASADRFFGSHQYSKITEARVSFAVFVPSAILPAYNVVLFPRVYGFSESVRVESVEPFDFHSALFPDTAQTPPEESTSPQL